MSQHPQILAQPKENCPYRGGRTLLGYFETLPHSVEVDEVILDGCISLDENLDMRRVLREPNTFYLVTVRDYADWLWSAYNYWCNEVFEEVELPPPVAVRN
eukprot:gene33065-40808_t